MVNFEKSETPKTWVTGFIDLIFSGNCAFVTRKVEIRLLWSSSTSVFISGYIIGSPTSDNAQCRGERPSFNRSSVTPTGKTSVGYDGSILLLIMH